MQAQGLSQQGDVAIPGDVVQGLVVADANEKGMATRNRRRVRLGAAIGVLIEVDVFGLSRTQVGPLQHAVLVDIAPHATVGAVAAERAEAVERVGPTVVALPVEGPLTAVATSRGLASTAISAVAAQRTQVIERVRPTVVALAVESPLTGVAADLILDLGTAVAVLEPVVVLWLIDAGVDLIGHAVVVAVGRHGRGTGDHGCRQGTDDSKRAQASYDAPHHVSAPIGELSPEPRASEGAT